MKINKFIDISLLDEAKAAEPVAPVVAEAVTETPPSHEHVDSVIFPASERFKHMLSLIARDNKELYNRIIGLE